MVDPITALSTAFGAIDLAGRARSSLSDTSFRKRLAKRVGDLCDEHDGFNFSKGALRRWLETDAAWEILRALDTTRQIELGELLDRHVIKATRRGRRLSEAEALETATTLASRLLAEFLASLDANYAVAVLHVRTEERFDQLSGLISSSGLHLEAIPPACWESLELTYRVSPDSARTVVQILSNTNSTESLATVAFSDPEPGWLAASPPTIWVAIAQFFGSHGAPGHASTAFKRAASKGAGDRATLLSRAALAAAETDTAEAPAAAVESLAAGESGLVIAINAHISGLEDEVLAALSDPFSVQGTDDQILAVSLNIAALIKVGRVPDAVAVLRQAIELYPNRGSLRMRLADALVVSSDTVPLGSADHDALVLEAAQQAEAAIALFRSWNGPSANAVEVACRLYLSTGQLDRVIEIGLPPPAGKALTGEQSAKSRTAVIVALIANGDTERAADILSGIEATDFQRLFLEAETKAKAGDPAATDAYVEAASAADDDAEKMFALMGLARLGKRDLPGLDQLRSAHPEWSALLEATAALNSGDPAEAASISAPWRKRAAPHAQLHAKALAQQGEIKQAISELESAARRFGAGHFIADAVDLLVADGAQIEAENLAARGLALVPSGQSGRWRLRRQILEISEGRQDWATYESHARTLISEFPNEPVAKWAVVFSLYLRQRRSDAWSELTGFDDLPVIDERTAMMKIDLQAQFEPGPDVVETALSLAQTYPDSEGVVGIAVKAALTGSGEGSLPEDTAAEARETLQKFMDRFPESDLVRQVKLDLDDIVNDLRPVLEPQARALEDVLRKVRFGELPGGVALAVRRLPYASYQGLYGAGVLCSVSPHPFVISSDRAAAEDALGSRVVIETSTLVPAMYLEKEFWQSEYFSALLIPDLLRDDAIAAVDEARSAIPTTMSWDVNRDQPVFHEATADELSTTVDHTEALLALIEDVCTAANTSTLPSLPGVGSGEFEPWMSSLRLAHGEGLALFSEDLGLRNLARGFGIPAFNTHALIEVLEDRGPISADRAENYKRDLVRAYVVDLPFDEQRLWDIAFKNHFKPGPATAALGRPAAWIERQRALGFLRTVVSYQAENDLLDMAPTWLAAASVGAALNAHISKRAALLGLLLMSVIVNTGIQHDNASDLVEASRSIVRLVGLDPSAVDPLVEAVPLVRDLMADIVVDGQVGAMVLWILRSLSEEDRGLVVRTLSR